MFPRRPEKMITSLSLFWTCWNILLSRFTFQQNRLVPTPFYPREGVSSVYLFCKKSGNLRGDAVCNVVAGVVVFSTSRLRAPRIERDVGRGVGLGSYCARRAFVRVDMAAPLLPILQFRVSGCKLNKYHRACETRACLKVQIASMAREGVGHRSHRPTTNWRRAREDATKVLDDDAKRSEDQ